MKLIFIRHAEPNYELNCLTEKGMREAEILVNRTKNWNVTDFHCSNYGRAQATAAPTLSYFGREAEIHEWLHEFDVFIDDPEREGNRKICWDFSPRYLEEHPLLFDPHRWWEVPIMDGCGAKKEYDRVCGEFDALLARYGYTRKGLRYVTNHTEASDSYMKYNGTTLECMKNAPAEEPVLVFFCHLGVMMVLLSHLMNTSPCTLWHGIFVPPTSVTTVIAEERIPSEVYFRAQCIGDTAHLREAGEPVSFYGGFDQPWQG